MSINDYPIKKPIELPKQGSWPKAMHVFEARDVHALWAAEAADRPLLIRGDPGTGKSHLARAAAVATKRLFVSVVVNARTECQDLQWRFDAVGRLGEAQALAVPGQGQNSAERIDARRFLSPGPLWWVFDWQSAEEQYTYCTRPLEPAPVKPNTWEPKQGSVLLIDEIDKAEADLPNGLLETLGNGDFAVPYRSRSVRQSENCPPPLVVITTNEERGLPAAFLRRCVVLHLRLPKNDQELLDFLIERGQVHFGEDCTERVCREAGELLLKDRKAAGDLGLPLPGQAEYLDLLRAVSQLATDEAKQIGWLKKINEFVLKKSPDLLEYEQPDPA